jgi:hypothetical protein
MNVSMFRKTVIATALIGAGLGSMSGAAFAGDDPGDGGHHSHGGHDSSKSSSAGCSNEISGESKNGSGDSLGDTTGGDQSFDASNLCHILTGNEILSNNNVAPLGNITNGDTVTRTLLSNSSDNSSTTTTIPGA